VIGCSAIQNPWFRKSRIRRGVIGKQTNKRVTFTVIVERVNSLCQLLNLLSALKPCTRFLSDSLVMPSLPDMIFYLEDKNGKVVRAPRSLL